MTPSVGIPPAGNFKFRRILGSPAIVFWHCHSVTRQPLIQTGAAPGWWITQSNSHIKKRHWPGKTRSQHRLPVIESTLSRKTLQKTFSVCHFVTIVPSFCWEFKARCANSTSCLIFLVEGAIPKLLPIHLNDGEEPKMSHYWTAQCKKTRSALNGHQMVA
jgi:hypothetical protein